MLQKKDFELWLKGEKAPAPMLDALIKRPVILKRPYRTILLTTMRKEFAARRTPEALVGNLFMNIISTIIPPTRIAAQNITKEAINRRNRVEKAGGKGEE